MAKITARGATAVAKLRAQKTIPADEPGGEAVTYTKIYALCSDGRVLHRVTGEYGSGYTQRGKVRDPKLRNKEFLETIIKRDGYTVLGEVK